MITVVRMDNCTMLIIIVQSVASYAPDGCAPRPLVWAVGTPVAIRASEETLRHGQSLWRPRLAPRRVAGRARMLNYPDGCDVSSLAVSGMLKKLDRRNIGKQIIIK